MADVESYYAAIRDQMETLKPKAPTGYLFVTSIRNMLKGSTEGTVSEVSLRIAAKHVVDMTARPSTEKEIEAFKQRGIEFKDQMAKRNFERKQAESGGTVIMMTPDGVAHQPKFVPPSESPTKK